MQLVTLDSSTAKLLGRKLLKEYRSQWDSFEKAAQLIVQDFFEIFCTAEGEPEFALIRVFRTMNFNELTPELQEIVEPKSGQFLSLMGTVGLEKAWCDRLAIFDAGGALWAE